MMFGVTSAVIVKHTDMYFARNVYLSAVTHYVNMPIQNHGASYHGPFAIMIGINDESFETVSMRIYFIQ